MIERKSEKYVEKVCDLKYLDSIMHGKKHLIYNIMEAFLLQIPKELAGINDAITETNYTAIKNFAHKMKSTVSIMGISVLTPVLEEIEDLGLVALDIEKIKELNKSLNLTCCLAMKELEIEKLDYI